MDYVYLPGGALISWSSGEQLWTPRSHLFARLDRRRTRSTEARGSTLAFAQNVVCSETPSFFAMALFEGRQLVISRIPFFVLHEGHLSHKLP